MILLLEIENDKYDYKQFLKSTNISKDSKKRKRKGKYKANKKKKMHVGLDQELIQEYLNYGKDTFWWMLYYGSFIKLKNKPYKVII